MAWTENYHCDVCGRPKNDEHHDWWLAFAETISPAAHLPDQPTLRLAPWNDFLSHSADVRHLCGARCAQTELDRWMNTTVNQPVAADPAQEV